MPFGPVRVEGYAWFGLVSLKYLNFLLEIEPVKFEVVDSNYESKVIDSFSRQPFMAFIGAKMVKIQPGYCEIILPYKSEISQQHGFFHGGIIGTIADNCGGYSAYSLMPANCSVLTTVVTKFLSTVSRMTDQLRILAYERTTLPR